jgi:hypothetical protein
MPVEQRVQEKVIQLTSNPSIDNKTKLAVRKRFYELKEKEIDLELLVETFNDSVATYEAQVDKIMGDVSGFIPEIKSVEPKKKVEEVQNDEEIIIPNKATKPGVKVRMQEELEDDDEEVEEVPYELSQE